LGIVWNLVLGNWNFKIAMDGEKREKGTFETTTESPEETLRLGRVLGEILPPGSFVALGGSLGAGKTLLAKGIAGGLGVEDEREVTSPSFVLVNEYRGRIPIFHLDLYRLETFAAVEGIGWDEFVCGPGVTLVEWADKVEVDLPEERIEVHLQWVSEEKRKLVFCGKGAPGETIIAKLEHRWKREE
jgi:tRNA threonylcarbamoyladenosine biosynthesis protein TsaE